MKENTLANDAFYEAHFKCRDEQGLDFKGTREAVKSLFEITNDHLYRARLSALANPSRYGGRYVSLRQFMKNQKTPLEITVSTVNPEANNVIATDEVQDEAGRHLQKA